MSTDRAGHPLLPELDGGLPVGVWPRGAPRVLSVDNHVLALVKPFNMPVMEDASADPDLLEWGRAWVKEVYHKPGRAWLGLLHRLDRPAAGVVLLARTSKAAARLSGQFRRHTVRKVYRVKVEGRLALPEGVLVHHLLKDPARNAVAVVDAGSAGGLEARLRYRLVDDGRDAEGRACSEVEIRLETGRPHQIRVQMASLGHPVLGDLRYGAARPLPAGHLALFCCEMEVGHPVGGRRQLFRAPLPERWESL